MVCRTRYPKAGQKICLSCYEKKNERAAGYVAEGLCSCGRKRALRKMRCVSCAASSLRSQKRKKRRLVKLGRVVEQVLTRIWQSSALPSRTRRKQ